jgi:tetrahydromethanopterin S-methyltransferase subunit B
MALLQRFAVAVAEEVRDLVATRTAPLEERISQLEAEVRGLRARSEGR